MEYTQFAQRICRNVQYLHIIFLEIAVSSKLELTGMASTESSDCKKTMN